MKKVGLLILGLNLFVQTQAQVDPSADFNRHVFESWKGQAIRIGPYSVKGSPYLFGESFPGSITYTSGNKLIKTNILYDVYHQKAGVELESQIYEANDPVESFTITLPEKFGGKTLTFVNAAVFNKASTNAYFTVLEDGSQVSLLKLFKSKLIADPTNTMDTKMKVFEQYFEYFLYAKNAGTLNGIKLKKKDIAKELGEKFVSEYAAANKTDFSNEEQIVDLVKAYNKK